MNKLAKMMTRREGFTLVELIVVIAILGILAGIAIPVYSGYINKANDAADLQQLDAIKTAAVFAATDINNDFGETKYIEVIVEKKDDVYQITGLNISNGTNVLSASTAPTDDGDFKTELMNLLGGRFSPLKGSYKSGAVWCAADGTTVGSGTSAKTYNAGWNVAAETD